MINVQFSASIETLSNKLLLSKIYEILIFSNIPDFLFNSTYKNNNNNKHVFLIA